MFFDRNRSHFFRPLHGRRREVVAACLRAMYESLHGPSADYSSTLTRDGLRDLFLPVVQQSEALTFAQGDTDEDEISSISGDLQVSSAIIRSLLADGWIEDFADRAGLITAYRFSRAGKIFAEGLWQIDRPSARSRQRNMRSCRNSLEAALRNLDPYDLMDAYDYAEKVIDDLSENVDYFQDLVRRLMSEVGGAPMDEFVDFLTRFEHDFKKQLTADNAERHRQSIRQTVERLRGLEDAKYKSLVTQFSSVATWTNTERGSLTAFEWVLDRIEDLVEAACNKKQPEMIRAMQTYIGRATSIVQQAMMLKSGHSQSAYLAACAQLKSLHGEDQDAFLNQIGSNIACAEVKLLDPAVFKLRTASTRKKALSVTVTPLVTREAKLAAAIARAESTAFSLSNEEVRVLLSQELALRDRPLRLSTMPANNAIDILCTMQAVEATRAPGQDSSFSVTRLPTKLVNDYYSGSDYLIEKKKYAK